MRQTVSVSSSTGTPDWVEFFMGDLMTVCHQKRRHGIEFGRFACDRPDGGLVHQKRRHELKLRVDFYATGLMAVSSSKPGQIGFPARFWHATGLNGSLVGTV
ncbi:hypothetical protein AVEN_145159-1 [Araneus ventricosus]|uniref:Uncharacterized protein n=1 Tax=Araneus ventricosus TaxID=182803 RepID=A0A4Y2R6E1_ARAVE|nr:hypothetical protein AVEN_145159-1 [Araneus ventricosus]